MNAPATSLPRKYRPSVFHEVIGQDHVAMAMKGAIESERIPQAIILTGIRGTGKTTIARIIAKSMNCERGPTFMPCGKCSSCMEIAGGSSLDVMEIDAASRNGVADIREITSSMNYAPMRKGGRKIFIIDEAHMLSTSAWNALLKSIEEPPSHVMFILATTEHRKIPSTIQSRCIKFKLRRLSIDEISKNLNEISVKEGLTLKPDASRLISIAAEGSMRDALSILDQAALTSQDKTIDARLVRDLVGLTEPISALGLLSLAVHGKAKEAVSKWRAMIHDGADPSRILIDMSEMTTGLLLATVDADLLDEIGIEEEVKKHTVRISGRLSKKRLFRIHEMLLEGASSSKSAHNPASVGETIMLRIALDEAG